MVDRLTFSERLDLALAQNGLDNASFAANFGKDPQGGQSLVNRWRSREQIGSQSERKARHLLPLTNFDWLQTGEGQPEAFSGVSESSPNYDVRQSYGKRRELHILTQAVKLVLADEALNGPYGYEKQAAVLLELCDRLEAGEDADVLGMKLTHERQKGEAINGTTKHPGDGKRKR